jgi:hypothetical protein
LEPGGDFRRPPGQDLPGLGEEPGERANILVVQKLDPGPFNPAPTSSSPGELRRAPSAVILLVVPVIGKMIGTMIVIIIVVIASRHWGREGPRSENGDPGGRLSFVQDDKIPEDVFVQLECPLKLREGRRVPTELRHDIISDLVFLDGVGELAVAPVVHGNDFTLFFRH